MDYSILFKKRGKFTKENMFLQWNVWWKNDFASMDDEWFHATYLKVCELMKKSLEEIKKGRQTARYMKQAPIYLQRAAAEKGYYIKKSSTSKHPLDVSGYALFKKNGSKKKPVYGRKFDLTANDIREILGYKGKTKTDLAADDFI